LRRERDAERYPDSKVKQREEGRTFQREGPMVAKDLIWTMVVPTRGTKIYQSKERSGRCEVAACLRPMSYPWVLVGTRMGIWFLES